jgi:hypothetical protein
MPPYTGISQNKFPIMKNIVIVSLVIILVAGVAAFILYNKKHPSDSGEVKFLKQFYTSYIIIESGYGPTADINRQADSLRRKNFTARMQKQYDNKPDFDVDIMVGVQYCPPQWVQNMNVSKAIYGNVYNVSFFDTLNQRIDTTTIQLRVVKEGSQYKIDELLRSHRTNSHWPDYTI